MAYREPADMLLLTKQLQHSQEAIEAICQGQG